MASHPLPREQRSATDAANGGRNAIMSETDSFTGQTVQVGSLHDRISCNAQSVMPPIVGVQHEDIHRTLSRDITRNHKRAGPNQKRAG